MRIRFKRDDGAEIPELLVLSGKERVWLDIDTEGAGAPPQGTWTGFTPGVRLWPYEHGAFCEVPSDFKGSRIAFRFTSALGPVEGNLRVIRAGLRMLVAGLWAVALVPSACVGFVLVPVLFNKLGDLGAVGNLVFVTVGGGLFAVLGFGPETVKLQLRNWRLALAFAIGAVLLFLGARSLVLPVANQTSEPITIVDDVQPPGQSSLVFSWEFQEWCQKFLCPRERERLTQGRLCLNEDEASGPICDCDSSSAKPNPPPLVQSTAKCTWLRAESDSIVFSIWRVILGKRTHIGCVPPNVAPEFLPDWREAATCRANPTQLLTVRKFEPAAADSAKGRPEAALLRLQPFRERVDPQFETLEDYGRLRLLAANWLSGTRIRLTGSQLVASVETETAIPDLLPSPLRALGGAQSLTLTTQLGAIELGQMSCSLSSKSGINPLLIAASAGPRAKRWIAESGDDTHTFSIYESEKPELAVQPALWCAADENAARGMRVGLVLSDAFRDAGWSATFPTKAGPRAVTVYLSNGQAWGTAQCDEAGQGALVAYQISGVAKDEVIRKLGSVPQRGATQASPSPQVYWERKLPGNEYNDWAWLCRAPSSAPQSFVAEVSGSSAMRRVVSESGHCRLLPIGLRVCNIDPATDEISGAPFRAGCEPVTAKFLRENWLENTCALSSKLCPSAAGGPKQ